MIIPARPAPDLSILLKARNKRAKRDTRLEHFANGRQALAAGLGLLCLPPQSTIIVPSYICASVLEPIQDAGLKIEFLEVGPDLNYCEAQLKKTIRVCRAKAVLLVHYFGFLSNVEAVHTICLDSEVKLIEDFCHSNLTTWPCGHLKILGDIAIFSFRKNLPIPDGGALFVTKTPHYLSQSKSSLRLSDIIFIINRLFETLICRLGILNIYGKQITSIKQNLNDWLRLLFGPYAIKTNDKTRAPSIQLNAYLNNACYINVTRTKIRRNYVKLRNIGKKLSLEPLHSDLAAGTVPQWVVLKTTDDSLVMELRKNGIGASTWPGYELPDTVRDQPQKYPNANYFNKHLILLPTHQNIDSNSIKTLKIVLDRVTQKT